LTEAVKVNAAFGFALITTLDRHRSPQQKMTFGLIHVGPIHNNQRALFAPDELFRELRVDTRALPLQAAIG
jgi:hypothetical protein